MSEPVLRIYVASASSEIERAEVFMKRLRDAGHKVTSTWPEVVRKVGAANPMGAPREQRARWAATDLNEVASSNVLCFLLPVKGPTAGAYTEFGYGVMMAVSAMRAQQLGIPAPPFLMLVVGRETSIFTALAERVETDDAAFAHINSLEPILAEAIAKVEQVAMNADAEVDEDDEEALPPEVSKQLDAIFAKAK